MTLKRQLILLGLLALLLPVFGWWHLANLDAALRGVRTAGLQEQAQVASRLLEQEQELGGYLAKRNARAPALWVSPMVANVLDGYLTEWREQSIVPVSFYDSDVRLRIGVSPQYLRMSFELPGKTNWYSPQQTQYDYLEVEFESQGRYRLLPSASGRALAMMWQGGRWRRAFNVEGVWLSSGDTGKVEWDFPRAYLHEGVSVVHHDATRGYSSFLQKDNQPAVLASIATGQLQAISALEKKGQKFWLFDQQGLLVASTGALDFGGLLPELRGRKPWLMRGYSWLAGQGAGAYSEPFGVASELSQWLFHYAAPVARVSVPVSFEGGLQAWLVLEKQEPAFEEELAGVAGQFLLGSLMFVVVLLLLLLGFASAHSWRIRRLAGYVESYESVAGNQEEASVLLLQFPVSKVPDEIGQLSRSFASLLGRLMQHQEYLKNLAAKLSHELRTPIAVARSSLDNTQTDAANRVYIDRAQAGLARLSSTLTAMSSANQLEAALAKTERETVPLHEMLPIVGEAYRSAYGSQCVQLELDELAPCDLRCAPELIVQMLDKLMDNACQFSVEGEPVVFAATSQSAEKGAWIVMSVTNVGPCLPSTIEEQLFESMVSDRDAAPADDNVHLGLGLYVARLICEFHGGTIRAYQKPNVGEAGLAEVTFEVRLPLAEAV